MNLDNLEKAGNLENFRLAAKGAREVSRAGVHGLGCLQGARGSVLLPGYAPGPCTGTPAGRHHRHACGRPAADGYLNSYFIVKEPNKRWANLRDWHDCIAGPHVRGRRGAFPSDRQAQLSRCSRQLADNIDSVFGPPPKRMGYSGHPEIELALIKLWRVTGNERYFKLAQFFVENRGRKFFAEEHKTPLDRYDVQLLAGRHPDL